MENEIFKLRETTQELYNDIDSCITNLINARTSSDADGEGKALFRMEGLMVATLQQLSCILDSMPKETVYLPSVWSKEDTVKLPYSCAWASIDENGNYEYDQKFYDADRNEITEEEYRALVSRTPED